MVVDRGNVQGLLIVPLYLFAVAWRNGRWRWVAIAIAVLAALKLYPARARALCCSRNDASAMPYFRSLQLPPRRSFFSRVFPGGFRATMRGFLAALVPFAVPTPDRIIVGNYSGARACWQIFAPRCFGVASPQLHGCSGIHGFSA